MTSALNLNYMKLFYFSIAVVILSLVLACSPSSTNDNNSILIYPRKSKIANEIFSKIELIPLDTVHQAYLSDIHRCQISDNHILFHDKDDILYLFDKKGKFISNSKKCIGEGPKDYFLCLSASYNDYSKNIEILTPDAFIIYDSLFHHVESQLFSESDKHPETTYFEYIYDISESLHILFPSSVPPHLGKYTLYDSKKKRFIKELRYNVEIEGMTMQENYFSNRNFVAFPCINYSFYEMDLDSKLLKKVVSLDFGVNGLTEQDVINLPKDREEKMDFLAQQCHKYIPVRTFRSGKFLISLIKEGPSIKDFQYLILDMETRDYIWADMISSSIRLPFFESFDDGILYGIITDDNIEDYVDRSLLDEKSKNILDNLSDDSNFMVIKYYLKQMHFRDMKKNEIQY